MKCDWLFVVRALRLQLVLPMLMLWGCIVPSATAEQDIKPADLAAKTEFFESRIRPVLVERCYSCHSASAEKLKGELHVDSLHGLLAGGETGPAIVLGHPEKSRMIKAIRYEDVDLEMPPKGKLTDQQIQDFETWVAEGAYWPNAADSVKAITKEKFNIPVRKKEHWAWQPVTATEIPLVKNGQWPVNAIDRFILSRLEASEISPAKPASKRELLRRITFDLIGLPPTEDEVEAFLNDESREAYPKVVDRLLNSPHFGEKWARHWLDLVRYAETFGHEFDYPILNAWLYRDYVIRAFNENLPYDQFVREHIAGDLIEKPRFNASGENESVQATAFYWLGQGVHSPVDIRAYQLDRIDNQIDVLTKAFQGMTVSCARCHDHKFDAISTKDYYSLFSVLASSRYAPKSIVSPEKNLGIIRQLGAVTEKLNAEVDPLLVSEILNARSFLDALREVKSGKPTLEDEKAGDNHEVVFEDFESGGYGGWTVTGKAFGTAPQTQQTIGTYQGNLSALGKYFVNSHNIRGGEGVAAGDDLTGRMISRKFTILHDYIHMLVGGGNHAGKTCVQLLIDGKVVRSQVGPNNNRMAPRTWNVQEFKGREAQIEVVDEATGGWGNIGLDHILFSNKPHAFGDDNQVTPGGRSVRVVAAEKQVDAARLQKWVTAYEQASGQLKQYLKSEAATLEKAPTEEQHIFAKGADFDQWIKEGEAFTSDASLKPALVPLGAAPMQLVMTEPGIHSAALSRKLEGAVRSHSFKISTPYIHVRAAGSDARLNVVIDGFTLIRAPIYGGLKLNLNNADPAWQTIDVTMWQGHECFLELLDQTAHDSADGRNSYSGDAWFSLHEVVFSKSKTAPQREVVPYGGVPIAVVNWMLAHRLLEVEEARVAELLKEQAALEQKLTPAVYVAGITEGNGFDDQVFVRGNPRTLGEKAARGYLEALEGNSEKFREGSGRRQLVEELLSPKNPLTTRVRVNWLWKHMFGQGLVPSIDNLGVLGEKPSHPELLDHLAMEYRQNGWNTKKMLREMALSRTYQMSSGASDAAALEKDPTNILLSRARVRRLDGELIRDSILAVSGSLKKEMGGKPVPIHLTDFMEGRGRPSQSGPLDGEGRRTIYLEVRRNFLSPLVLAFDGPIPFTTVGRRSISNVPAQALILMNDPFVIGEARAWAKRQIETGSIETMDARIERMFSKALGRQPASDEIENGKQFLASQAKLYQVSPAEIMHSVDVWADFAHVMFNLKEFVFIN